MKECSEKKIEKICKNKTLLFDDWFFAWFKLVVYYWANYFSFRRELAMPEKKKKNDSEKISYISPTDVLLHISFKY